MQLLATDTMALITKQGFGFATENTFDCIHLIHLDQGSSALLAGRNDTLETIDPDSGPFQHGAFYRPGAHRMS